MSFNNNVFLSGSPRFVGQDSSNIWLPPMRPNETENEYILRLNPMQKIAFEGQQLERARQLQNSPEVTNSNNKNEVTNSNNKKDQKAPDFSEHEKNLGLQHYYSNLSDEQLEAILGSSENILASTENNSNQTVKTERSDTSSIGSQVDPKGAGSRSSDVRAEPSQTKEPGAFLKACKVVRRVLAIPFVWVARRCVEVKDEIVDSWRNWRTGKESQTVTPVQKERAISQEVPVKPNRFSDADYYFQLIGKENIATEVESFVRGEKTFEDSFQLIRAMDSDDFQPEQRRKVLESDEFSRLKTMSNLLCDRWEKDSNKVSLNITDYNNHTFMIETVMRFDRALRQRYQNIFAE